MRFPPLPRTVAEVSQLLAEHNDVPDTHRLVEIVNADPVIAASVLRRINSAYYGMRRRVGDIRKAVFLLGFLEVCNIVLTSGMMRLRDVVKTKEQIKVFEQIMRLSVGSAFYAQELALHLKLPRRSTAFTVGLLHAVGRLILLYNKPNDYEALWWTSEEGIPPSPADEQLIFGTDHTQLGALAADRWNLPEEISEVIRYYLKPDALTDEASRVLAETLAVSVAATEQLQLGTGKARNFTPPRVLYALARSTGTPAHELSDLVESVHVQTFSYVQSMVANI